MSKEEIKNYVAIYGYTKLAVQHPNTSKALILEVLEECEKDEAFKEYYREFVNDNFN